jgi:hypothetical protein
VAATACEIAKGIVYGIDSPVICGMIFFAGSVPLEKRLARLLPVGRARFSRRRIEIAGQAAVCLRTHFSDSGFQMACS